MILEIPKELEDIFVHLLDIMMVHFILDFGGDLSEDELQVVELLQELVESSIAEGQDAAN